MRRNMVVAVVIFLLALLASSVAWAHGSRGHHGHGHHGFRHHGHGHHGFRHHGHGHHRHHHHSHGRVGADIVIGGPVWHYRTYPRYYAQPQAYIYSYPPVFAMQSAPPPVFVERGDQQGLNQTPQAFWYYCGNPQGYYPYVSSCPKGWQTVPAQPPAVP